MDRSPNTIEFPGQFPLTSVNTTDVLSDEAIRANWQSLAEARPNGAALSRGRIVTYDRFDPSSIEFDKLRTTLAQKMRDNDWTSVLITSPTPGSGKTAVSLNLAFSLARHADRHTVLLDLDLRRPQLASILRAKDPPAMERLLRREVDCRQFLRAYAKNLAIGLNNRSVRLGAELLQSEDTKAALAQIKTLLKPDFVLIDTPPILANDDVQALLPHVDCVLLVVAAEETTEHDLDYCEQLLSERSNLVGVVLNKCRYMPERYGY
jgi:Mrp family chromosome partitioning ATPase